MSSFVLHYTEWFVGVAVAICIVDSVWQHGIKRGIRIAENRQMRLERRALRPVKDLEMMAARPYRGRYGNSFYDQDIEWT